MFKNLEDVQVQTDSDRLVILIRQLNITQYEFANELGYNRVYLESVINGRSPFTESLRNRIDSYLEKKAEENLKK